MTPPRWPGWLDGGEFALGLGLLVAGAGLLHGRRRARLAAAADQDRLDRVAAERDRLRAECERLARRGRLAEAILGGGEEALGSLGLLLQELFDAPCSCVGLLDSAGSLQWACNCADGGAHVVFGAAADSAPAPLRRALEAHGPLVVTDTGGGPGAPRAPLLAARLADGERALGVIAVGGRPGGYGAGDLDTIAGIAAELAPLVQARLAAQAAGAQAAQAQKLQALGVMAGGIAHDFNNILQAILGFSALAREDAADPARLTADLDRVQRAALRGRDLVQRLLCFSRPTEAAATAVDPLPLLEDVARQLRAAQPPTIRVEVAADPGCGQAKAAPEHLRQALVDLARNAIQAMGAAGGTLRLSAAPARTAADDLRFPADWRGREAVVFTVADTGPGIPADIRARLFDPFFTTRAVGQGTGLGLSVVHGLVAGLGGHVVIECPAAGGTLASVYLPRADDVGRAVATPPLAEVAAGPPLRGRVLFVDDEPEIRELAAALLDRAGLEVATAADGPGAWERLGREAFAFDVVVTDQYMPGFSGSELAGRVASLRPDLPVILVTGLDEPAVAGAPFLREVVTKPFASEALLQAVARALAHRRGGAAP